MKYTSHNKAMEIASELLAPFLLDVRAEVVVLLAEMRFAGSSIIKKKSDVYSSEYSIYDTDVLMAIDIEYQRSTSRSHPSVIYLKKFEDDLCEFTDTVSGERVLRPYETIYTWYLLDDQFFPAPAEEGRILHEIVNTVKAAEENSVGPYTRYEDSWELIL